MSKGWLVMTTATWSAIIRGRQSWGLSHLLGRCFWVVRAACCSRLVKMGASYKIPYSGKWGLTNTAFLGSCGWWIHGACGWREEEEEGEGEEGKRKKRLVRKMWMHDLSWFFRHPRCSATSWLRNTSTNHQLCSFSLSRRFYSWMQMNFP